MYHVVICVWPLTTFTVVFWVSAHFPALACQWPATAAIELRNSNSTVTQACQLTIPMRGVNVLGASASQALAGGPVLYVLAFSPFPLISPPPHPFSTPFLCGFDDAQSSRTRICCLLTEIGSVSQAPIKGLVLWREYLNIHARYTPVVT
jgi:hypothetical protein